MKKIVKIVFIGLSVLIIVLTICIIIWLFHQKSDISDVPNQISVSSGNQISSTINMEEDLEIMKIKVIQLDGLKISSRYGMIKIYC